MGVVSSNLRFVILLIIAVAVAIHAADAKPQGRMTQD
jgi:hypothetical protein